MSVYNIFNMASGEELGRYFAYSSNEALDAMARTAGYADYDQACGVDPAIKDRLLITEL